MGGGGWKEGGSEGWEGEEMVELDGKGRGNEGGGRKEGELRDGLILHCFLLRSGYYSC